MRLLEAIVAANHAATEGRPGKAEFNCFQACLPLAALTCIDPRLNRFLPGALGLQDEQFIWLRNAGNVITSPTSSTVRSVAMAVFLKGAKEIAVIGHTDCKMAQFNTTALLDKLQAAGISRGALPIPNLTEFFGLFSSEKPNILKAVGFLRTSPVIPPKTPIHGLIMDSNTGRLEWVVNGYESSGLPLETHGAPEDVTLKPAYSTGPVKSLGSHVVPLAAPTWKPSLPKIGGATTPPPPPPVPPLAPLQNPPKREPPVLARPPATRPPDLRR